jgi:uncharacterized delta-60 repeat protein
MKTNRAGCLREFSNRFWLSTIVSVSCFTLAAPALAAPDDVDPSFVTPGANNAVVSVVPQPDGKVLAGGWFTTFGGTSPSRNRIVRLNANGSLDSNFTPGIAANNDVYSVALQADEKVLIGGAFTSFNNTNRNGIARLNANGSLDLAFDPGTGANGAVEAVIAQPDGKVLIAGAFTSVNETNRNRIALLNSDGSLDLDFDPGTGANGKIWAAALQADGKVVVAGDFGIVNGTNRVRVARLNADGSLDTEFDPAGGPNNRVYSVAVQSDGKVLIGGQFSLVNGVSRSRIARLNANGALDTDFNPGTGANDPSVIFAVAWQPNGKVLIGGNFTSINNTNRSRMARLNDNGSLDAEFAPNVDGGVIVAVHSIVVQLDGKVLFSGLFTSINGIARPNIARLIGDPPAWLAPVLTFGPTTDNGDFVVRFAGTPGVDYTIECQDAVSGTNWQKLFNVTAPTNDIGFGIGAFELREAIVPSGERFYRCAYPAY